MKGKEWLKNEIKKDANNYPTFHDERDDLIKKMTSFNNAIALIDQLDEPKAVVCAENERTTGIVEVPQFVADWIEHLKKDKPWLSLYGALNYSHRVQSETKKWLSTDNSELFATAWMNGYTIETPKTLQIIIKNYDSTVYKTELPEDEAMKLIEGWKGNE